MSSLDREVSRRTFLGVLGFGMAVAALGGTEYVVSKNSEIFNGPTEEQKKAKEILENLDGAYNVPDLIVTGDVVGGERKAYYRDKPRLPADADDTEKGNREGSLKIGATISKWIAVEGNDQQVTMDSSRTDRWVAFLKGDRAYFAHKSLFDNLAAIQQAPVFDLSK